MACLWIMIGLGVMLRMLILGVFDGWFPELGFVGDFGVLGPPMELLLLDVDAEAMLPFFFLILTKLGKSSSHCILQGLEGKNKID